MYVALNPDWKKKQKKTKNKTKNKNKIDLISNYHTKTLKMVF